MTALITPAESFSLRVSNVVGDALARGGAIDLYPRVMRRARYVIATITHPSLRVARHAAGRTLEQACDRAARIVARLPVPVAGGAR